MASCQKREGNSDPFCILRTKEIHDESCVQNIIFTAGPLWCRINIDALIVSMQEDVFPASLNLEQVAFSLCNMKYPLLVQQFVFSLCKS